MCTDVSSACDSIITVYGEYDVYSRLSIYYDSLVDLKHTTPSLCVCVCDGLALTA